MLPVESSRREEIMDIAVCSRTSSRFQNLNSKNFREMGKREVGSLEAEGRKEENCLCVVDFGLFLECIISLSKRTHRPF